MASKSSVVDEYAKERVCPVHLANIHERRTAAILARAFPLVTFVLIGLLALTSAFYWTRLLLLLCTLFNLSIGVGLSQSGLQCILGMRKLREMLKEKVEDAPEAVEVEECYRDAPCNTVHLVVVPSYKEDEALLSQTLEAIAQAEGAKNFRVALAMEAREGPDGEVKGDRLKEKFAPRFARVDVTRHPADLEEVHIDGSSNPEVPSKGSNVKWALRELFGQCIKDGLASDNVLLTVADADVIFHPKYFNQIGREFEALREAPGDQHVWTMWQAPQLPFRNYSSAPVVSRLHSCITSVYEFGGVSGLLFGADHMTFSTYSLPAQLATKARVFEGDVIAEDHHCHLRCVFYAIRAALLAARAGSSANSDSSSDSSSDDAQPVEASGPAPTLRLRPVMLPLKSTAVVSDEGVLQTWKDRWNQAYRHAQGLAEMSFALLATWDVVRHLPAKNPAVGCKVLYKALRLVHKMFWVHLVPPGQFLCMGVLLFEMTFIGTVRPMCRSSAHDSFVDHTLCALAGVWLPMWPIAVPMTLIIISNLLFVPASFKYPAQSGHDDGAVWKSEDGGLARWPMVAFGALVAVDLLVFGGPLFLIYGVLATIFAYWNVMLNGNQFKYITAVKGMEQMRAAREAESSALLNTTA